MSVSPPAYCPPLSCLLWAGISCIVTRKQNIRRAQPSTVPRMKMSLGNSSARWDRNRAWLMTGVTCVPGPGRMLAAAQTLVTWLGKMALCGWAQENICGPKRSHRLMNNEAAEMGKEMRNTCAVQHINVMCSAFFWPFFCYYLITASSTCWVKYS